MQNRRKFLSTISLIAAGSLVSDHLKAGILAKGKKLKVVLIGTGVRGTSFWGKRLMDAYSDILTFDALVDPNAGRLEYARNYISVGKDCGLYHSFEAMIKSHDPDLIIVTTPDSSHHEYVIKALENGIDVLTEKPLTVDEAKCQAILDAEQKYQRKVFVGFNLRWSPYNARIKQMLNDKIIGDIVSVDFSWNLNTSHGASYFRRWHGQMEYSGSLLVHKSTHHFDLLNWWLNSEPEKVFAFGDLEYYGRRQEKKGVNCRNCNEKDTCKFYWDINTSKSSVDLYVKNEHLDGYIRDSCVFRPDIDIYDKMNLNIRYANNVYVNYMLTTYSPWEGWHIAFNGTKGRLEAFMDVPYMDSKNLSQEELHRMEMNQQGSEDSDTRPIITHKLWDSQETLSVPHNRSGHGGGDKLLQDNIFRNIKAEDTLHQTAGTRDGAMSVLIGIAARNSIETGEPVLISSLTDLKPKAQRF
ncbi:MAG: Gfo/Idh/MocA family oxidoreductase [Cyclobacteriaceae bacterium]|nr:Gfo/Idh/MocA family oxidoreductase [Cyclobacteriaceae bacterium SS2]